MYEISLEGEQRYKYKCPSGYMAENDESDNEVRFFGNFSYKKKYTDLILWKEMIRESKISKISTVIFITDEKEDWLFKTHGQTIGPRAELKQELLVESNAYLIIMNTDSFVGELTGSSGVDKWTDFEPKII